MRLGIRQRVGRLGAAFLGDRSGVAAVEFALISPTIILVLVGLIDLGGMLYTRFQLDASLGLISIEQNAAMKLFSWAAVVFLPPTLIAGIYGMNFHEFPELSWPWGYPMALALMLATAVGPYLYFKKRGWI